MNVANKILIQDVVDVLLLVDGEDVPVFVNGATSSSKNNFASWVCWNPVGDVVYFISVNDPWLIRCGIVFANF